MILDRSGRRWVRPRISAFVVLVLTVVGSVYMFAAHQFLSSVSHQLSAIETKAAPLPVADAIFLTKRLASRSSRSTLPLAVSSPASDLTTLAPQLPVPVVPVATSLTSGHAASAIPAFAGSGAPTIHPVVTEPVLHDPSTVFGITDRIDVVFTVRPDVPSEPSFSVQA